MNYVTIHFRQTTVSANVWRRIGSCVKTLIVCGSSAADLTIYGANLRKRGSRWSVTSGK